MMKRREGAEALPAAELVTQIDAVKAHLKVLNDEAHKMPEVLKLRQERKELEEQVHATYDRLLVGKGPQFVALLNELTAKRYERDQTFYLLDKRVGGVQWKGKLDLPRPTPHPAQGTGISPGKPVRRAPESATSGAAKPSTPPKKDGAKKAATPNKKSSAATRTSPDTPTRNAPGRANEGATKASKTPLAVVAAPPKTKPTAAGIAKKPEATALPAPTKSK